MRPIRAIVILNIKQSLIRKPPMEQQTATNNLVDVLLDTIEHRIIPKTESGVAAGNKIFGAALLRKSDLSLVLAETNNETENPLWHGEIHTLKRFFEMRRIPVQIRAN